MPEPSDVANLPMRAQLALQRFERRAAAQKAQLAALLKAQPATVAQSTRYEVGLKRLKETVSARAALISRISEHYKEVRALLTPEIQTTAGSAAPTRKTTSAGE